MCKFKENNPTILISQQAYFNKKNFSNSRTYN